MSTSTEGRILTPADIARLKQLSNSLKQTSSSFKNRDTVSNTITLYDANGTPYQVPSLAIDRRVFTGSRPRPPIDTQNTLPAADTRIDTAIVSHINDAVTAITRAIGLLFNNIGAELGRNEAASFLVIFTGIYLISLLLSDGDDMIPRFHKHKLREFQRRMGEGSDQEWRRQDNGGQLRADGEIADPYAEATNVQRLMRVADQYKARYGSLDIGVLRQPRLWS